MKTEVYSWRVSTELKTELEREARRLGISLSAVLDLAAQDWLTNSGDDANDDETQRRLHQAALKYVGALASGNSRGAERVRQTVRRRLLTKHGR